MRNLLRLSALILFVIFIGAENNKMDRNQLVRELIFDEGMVLEIYKDHLGYETFGVGHLITDKDDECGQPVGTPVSEQRVLTCLEKDIDTICAELDRALPWWRELDDNRQRVMANMGFNLGLTRLLKFKKFLSAMERGDFNTAAVEMMDSLWATQVGPRAHRLRNLVLGDNSV